jgi:DNA-binding response OmpR family regulator
MTPFVSVPQGRVSIRLASYLQAMAGRAVTLEELVNVAYFGVESGGPDDAKRSVKVQISKLRKRLSPGYEIQPARRGYYILTGKPTETVV